MKTPKSCRMAFKPAVYENYEIVEIQAFCEVLGY